MDLDSNEMIIRLPENSADAYVSIRNGKTISKKIVSVPNLISSLAKEQRISTGLMPRGTRVYSGSGNNYIIVVEVPAGIRPINYNTKNLIIPHPSYLFFFKVVNSSVVDVRILALGGPITSLKNVLYRFPFGNTYGDGRICWGSVRLPKIENPINLISIISMFLDSKFNGDLSGGCYNHKESFYLEDFLKFLDNKETFPIDTLVKIPETIECYIN
jgi:hypothetical protein